MKKQILALALAAILAPSFSQAASNAVDAASNYASSWADGSNQGTNFTAWTFRTSTPGGGAAGMFLAGSGNTDLNGIPTATKAWGTFANGAGFQDAVAYRGFTGGSLSTSQSFKLSVENGGISTGNSMGFTLRTGNTNASTANYNSGSRFEFLFLGGTNNYSIIDGGGLLNTGVGFTDGGLDITFTLKSSNTYDLTIFRIASSTTTSFTNRTLSGASGAGLDSFALYNRSTDDNNVYFNSVSVIPEPSSILAAALATGFCAYGLRKRARKNKTTELS